MTSLRNSASMRMLFKHWLSDWQNFLDRYIASNLSCLRPVSTICLRPCPHQWCHRNYVAVSILASFHYACTLHPVILRFQSLPVSYDFAVAFLPAVAILLSPIQILKLSACRRNLVPSPVRSAIFVMFCWTQHQKMYMPALPETPKTSPLSCALFFLPSLDYFSIPIMRPSCTLHRFLAGQT